MTGWLVASDVDHTLLERSEEAPLAGESLRHLHRLGATTLLASSKTFGEMVTLHEDAGLAPQPFLFENGLGIGWPLGRGEGEWPAPPLLRRGDYGAVVLERDGDPEGLADLLRTLRTRGGLRFELLGDLPADRVACMLGLSEAGVGLALDRLASVPLVWEDDEAALCRLRGALAAHGLSAVCGGRLVHVGPAGSKGESLARVLPWLGGGGSGAGDVLACGDAETDRSLLENAAVALVFHPEGSPPMSLAAPPAGREPLRRDVVAGGPRRWLEAVEAALVAAGPPRGTR